MRTPVMQTCSRYCQRRLLISNTFKRHLSSRPVSISNQAGPVPWFIDPSDARPPPAHPSAFPSPSPNSPLASVTPLPPSIPPSSIISRLHSALLTSPHLEPGTLLVRDPIPTDLGPPLPDSVPRGKKKRGRTYAGEGVPDHSGGPWSWVVLAQVSKPFLRNSFHARY